jgi:Ni,Fe-hydrogenase III component G
MEMKQIRMSQTFKKIITTKNANSKQIKTKKIYFYKMKEQLEQLNNYEPNMKKSSKGSDCKQQQQLNSVIVNKT